MVRALSNASLSFRHPCQRLLMKCTKLYILKLPKLIIFKLTSTEAGIEYYFVYMTGLAGKGGGYQNARNSAELFSQLNPYFISVDSLTLFPDTELYQMAQQGLFVPAEEKERIRELQVLINNLNIRTHLFANTVSNFTPVTAYLPYDREKVTNELQFVLDNTDEREMQEYRNNLKSLG